MYTLFQRDRGDAPEPMSMLFYDPQVSGEFWDGLALDHHFDNITDGWVSMRSSWTDTEGTYAAMKSGAIAGHQTHGDIDAGDFVLDAIGQRWAGELGSGNYLADGYFNSEAQNAQRCGPVSFRVHKRITDQWHPQVALLPKAYRGPEHAPHGRPGPERARPPDDRVRFVQRRPERPRLQRRQLLDRLLHHRPHCDVQRNVRAPVSV